RERERGGGGCRRVSGGRRRQRRRSRRSGGAGGTGLSVARGRRRILEVAAVPVIARILRVHGVQRLTQIVRCTSGGDTPVILHRLARHRLALDGLTLDRLALGRLLILTCLRVLLRDRA